MSFLKTERRVPEPIHDEPSFGHHLRPTVTVRGEEEKGDSPPKDPPSDPPDSTEINGRTRGPGGARDASGERRYAALRQSNDPPDPTPITGNKRGGDEESAEEEDPPPPREITGPKRGG